MSVNLEQYGWSDFFAEAKKDSENSELAHGRVISVHKSRYEVVMGEGIFSCEILGNIQFQKDPLGLPAVGDWVLLSKTKDTYVIHEVLPRQSLIKRQKKHDRFPKAIAANIDKAIIVQAVGEDFNPKRIERILVHVYEAGVVPMIVINKIDTATDLELEDMRNQLNAMNKDIDILFTSFVTGAGINELENKLNIKETVMFIGSSGVGKSSIINYMVGRELQETQEITESTGKGKHTTTARRLIRMDSGVLLIDTPGTREFGMNEDDIEAIKQSFEHIENIALSCRFSNCSHGNEPSCAVQEALGDGSIDPKNYEQYIHLQIEQGKTAKQMRQDSKISSKQSRKNEPLRSVRAGKTKARKKMFR